MIILTILFNSTLPSSVIDNNEIQSCIGSNDYAYEVDISVSGYNLSQFFNYAKFFGMSFFYPIYYHDKHI